METTSITQKTQTKTLKTWLILLGAILFNAIFWNEKMAVNAALFFGFLMFAMHVNNPHVWKNRYVKILSVSTLLSLAALIINNSQLSQISFVISVILLAAYSQYNHRSPFYASGSILQSFIFFIPTFFKNLQLKLAKKGRSSNWLKRMRFVILPILISIVFFFTYKMANKVFADVTNKIGVQIGYGLASIASWIAPERLLFVLIGLWITGGLLVRYIKAPIEGREALQTNDLERKKRIQKNGSPSLANDFKRFFLGNQALGNMGLKYEYKAGLLCLAILNLILVFVNISDLLYVWLGFAYNTDIDWVEYVHSGAEMLVLSIVLAMIVVLFFFRGNLNFFRNKSLLKQIAYVWIIQNAFLALSVCMRNYHYVTKMGLTYKRIGVFTYVLLVLIGLFFILQKIKNKKTGYYLLKANAVAAYVVLVIASFIQWDAAIAKYNLTNKNNITVDVAFLLSLSDHALPVLVQHQAYLALPQNEQQSRYYSTYDSAFPSIELQQRINNYLSESKRYTWLSWNAADAQALKQLAVYTLPATSFIK